MRFWRLLLQPFGPEVPPRMRFGNIALVAFLVVQLLDGALTYLALGRFGLHIEGNPLVVWMIQAVGEGPALTSAKMLAGSCGIALHLVAVHRIVALLAGLHMAVAILPWLLILIARG